MKLFWHIVVTGLFGSLVFGAAAIVAAEIYFCPLCK